MWPTKTQVLNYRPVHFGEAATNFGNTAGTWEAATGTQHAEAMALVGEAWRGLAAGAYGAVATVDHAEVTAGAAQATAAAAVATASGGEVWPAQRAAQWAIEDAQARSINVDEGLTQATDRLPPSPDAAVRAWRQAEVTWHAGQIAESVGTLVAADTAAAGAIRGPGDFSAYHTSTNGHIAGHVQAVDNHIGHGDPPPGPVPPGKQWWWHEGTGWKLDDHLKPCDTQKVLGDLASIVGGLIAAPTLPHPAGILAEFNAGRAIADIDTCEGP